MFKCSKAKRKAGTTILVKTFGALSVSGEEIAIQVDPSPRLHGQCWLVASQTPFTYLAHVKVLNFVCGGEGGNSC